MGRARRRRRDRVRRALELPRGAGAGRSREATLAAIEWWQDDGHYGPADVLYGLIGLLGLLWLVVPALVAFFRGRDLPFPTLFQTVVNLEEWLRGRGRYGPFLAWLVTYVIVAGLVILLLHLTLYPYPDITHILNPKG